MGKAKTGKASAGAKSEETRKVEPPPGFTETVATTDRAAGWVVKKEGAVVMGRLLGRQEMRNPGKDGNTRAFYRVELHADCVCVVGKGEDAQEATLTKGEIVNIDESTALEDLETRTRDGGTYDIWLRYGKQDKANRGFWPVDIRLKVIHKPTIEVHKRAPRKRDDDRDRDDRPSSRDDYDYGRPTRDRDDDR